MSFLKSLSVSYIKKSLLTVLAIALTACGSLPSADSTESTELFTVREINKAVVSRFMQNRLNMSASELAEEFFADDYQQIRFEFENLSYNVQDSELAEQAQPIHQAISNRVDRLDLVVGEGSSVAVRYYIKGNHAGNLYGIPATGKDFEIESVAVFELTDGKITEGWFMADEVGLLIQLDTPMPAREDGQYNIPPTGGEHAIASDDILSFMLANPAATPEYRKKLKIAARKANNPPPGIINEENGARPYDNFLRPGFKHIVQRGAEYGDASMGFGGAFPDRVDKMDYFMIDGDHIMIRFRLTGTNTVSMFGLPPSNKPVDGWEVAFMTFVDEHWRDAWWIGDDQSMLMQLGGPQSYWFGPASELSN